MEITKLVLDWSASIAWPLVVLVIAIMFRIPIINLLERLNSIADRVSRDAVDLQLGEKLKVSFKEAIEKANPKNVEEAVQVAEKEAEKIITVYETLRNIPIQQHHKDLLLKVAKGGDDGIHWKYKGDPKVAPGRTMDHLLQHRLVSRDGDRYYTHPLIRKYIFEIYSN